MPNYENTDIHPCPLCQGKNTMSREDYSFLISRSLDRLTTAEESRLNEFMFLARMTKEIRDRLFGSHVGSIQENMTILELKSTCPYDAFVEDFSSRHGTDILATVRERGENIGMISVSVKHQKKWNSSFISQLEKNIKNDKSSWGLLVTTAFPRESLNENMWTTLDSNGRLLLMAKPTYAAAAYYAIRQILVYQHVLAKAIEDRQHFKNRCEGIPEMGLQNDDHSVYLPVVTTKGGHQSWHK